MGEHQDLSDKDDALDFMIYEDIENETKPKSSKTGCLGLLIYIILPVGMFFKYGS